MPSPDSEPEMIISTMSTQQNMLKKVVQEAVQLVAE